MVDQAINKMYIYLIMLLVKLWKEPLLNAYVVSAKSHSKTGKQYGVLTVVVKIVTRKLIGVNPKVILEKCQKDQLTPIIFRIPSLTLKVLKN